MTATRKNSISAYAPISSNTVLYWLPCHLFIVVWLSGAISSGVLSNHSSDGGFIDLLPLATLNHSWWVHCSGRLVNIHRGLLFRRIVYILRVI